MIETPGLIKGTPQRPLRLYADGVFDSFHVGHSNMFKQCKAAFPGQTVWLMGGVCAQEDVVKFKGPTISTEQERIQMVRQCRYIDEVVEKAPWILDEEFLTRMNIDYVCHDQQPYVTVGTEDAYALCKKLGKFKATERTKGISTTDVTTKILRNKDAYYVRSLRKGKTREELGISWIDYLVLRGKMLLCPARLAMMN